MITATWWGTLEQNPVSRARSTLGSSAPQLGALRRLHKDERDD